MMKIDSTTVQLVLAIAEEGSISRAADRLQLAVAAASRRLSDLEQQLGARLFKRQPMECAPPSLASSCWPISAR